MRFSVGNWHVQKPEAWLEFDHAYTIMASPPPWAKAHQRNLTLFAAPPTIVFGHVSEEQYKDVFRETLRSRLPQIRQWISLHEDDQVVLLCACPDGRFCHRHLVAKLLIWLGCEQHDIPENPGSSQ